MCLGALTVCVSVHIVCTWCLRMPEEGVTLLKTGITDVCEQPCGCWKSNSSPLEEQLVLLTAEISLQDILDNFVFIIT